MRILHCRSVLHLLHRKVHRQPVQFRLILLFFLPSVPEPEFLLYLQQPERPLPLLLLLPVSLLARKQQDLLFRQVLQESLLWLLLQPVIPQTSQ